MNGIHNSAISSEDKAIVEKMIATEEWQEFFKSNYEHVTIKSDGEATLQGVRLQQIAGAIDNTLW